MGSRPAEDFLLLLIFEVIKEDLLIKVKSQSKILGFPFIRVVDHSKGKWLFLWQFGEEELYACSASHLPL